MVIQHVHLDGICIGQYLSHSQMTTRLCGVNNFGVVLKVTKKEIYVAFQNINTLSNHVNSIIVSRKKGGNMDLRDS